MNKMSMGNCNIMIVERERNGMTCEAYKNRLDAVLNLINNGAIGGGIGYGCEEHKSALAAIENQISDTRASIAEMEVHEHAADCEPGEDC